MSWQIVAPALVRPLSILKGPTIIAVLFGSVGRAPYCRNRIIRKVMGEVCRDRWEGIAAHVLQSNKGEVMPTYSHFQELKKAEHLPNPQRIGACLTCRFWDAEGSRDEALAPAEALCLQPELRN